MNGIRISVRRVSFVALILAFVILFATSMQAASDGLNSAKVIRFGFAGGFGNVKYIGLTQGFFEKEFGADGIKLEFEQFTYGPPIIEGISAGGLDFGLDIGDMPVITGFANGVKFKVVLKNPYTLDGDTLVVSVNSPIKTAADLKGKKIATSVGSSCHAFILLALESAGLKEADVEIVNLAPIDMEAALATDQVDAIATWEPYNSIILSKKIGKTLLTSRGIRLSYGFLVGRDEFLEQNPEITARLLKVVLQVYEFMDKEREKAIKIIASESGFEEDDIRKKIETSVFKPYFDDYDRDQVEKTKQFLLARDAIPSDFNVSELFTDKYLSEGEKLFNESKEK